MPRSQRILMNSKAKKVKIIFQPQKMKSTPLKPHTKEIMKKIMMKILKKISKRMSKQCSQNVDVNGPHHRCFELIVSSSFNQPMAVERGRSHELVGSMVGDVYVHVLRTLYESRHSKIYSRLFTCQLKKLI